MVDKSFSAGLSRIVWLMIQGELLEDGMPTEDGYKPWTCVCCQEPAQCFVQSLYFLPERNPPEIGSIIYILRCVDEQCRTTCLMARDMIQTAQGNQEKINQSCGFYKIPEDLKKPHHKQCSRCKILYYYNQECQKAHWKVHKKVQTDDSDLENVQWRQTRM
jgi:hypothetical protein